MTLDEALKKIQILEEENRGLVEENLALKQKIEAYRNRNMGGRKKHNEAWMESYNDFAVKFDAGMTIMEIVAEGNISRRTAYRYKAYYDELKKLQGENN